MPKKTKTSYSHLMLSPKEFRALKKAVKEFTTYKDVGSNKKLAELACLKSTSLITRIKKARNIKEVGSLKGIDRLCWIFGIVRESALQN